MKKIDRIRGLRDVSNMSLQDAKCIIEGHDYVVKESLRDVLGKIADSLRDFEDYIPEDSRDEFLSLVGKIYHAKPIVEIKK